MHIYRDTIETAWAFHYYHLKGKRGTRIYKEKRTNHIPGMVQVTPQGEIPLAEIEYLIFEIPERVDPRIFSKSLWRMGLKIKEIPTGTEISMHYPLAFHNELIDRLEKLGYVRQTLKETDKESGYSLYVNARGWQILYNLISLSFYGLEKLIRRGIGREGK